MASISESEIPESEVLAESQWTRVTIEAKLCDVSVKNANRSWGKFYECPNSKGTEVSDATINSIRIPQGEKAMICACGRANSSSGTEGTFELYDNNVKIGKYYWESPWSGSNKATWTSASDKYVVQLTGGNFSSGALGDTNLKVVKID
jgi:hypothetical protein